MTKFTLTVIDTSGIQRYIFGSNSLRHNIGASALVNSATHDWAFEELVAMEKTNVNRSGFIPEYDKVGIDTHDLNSELVYAGGGNAIIIFKDIEPAKEFTRRLTRRTLLDAPGLQLIVKHLEFDWNNDKLVKIVKSAMGAVNKKKLNHIHSAPLLGLGVTAECQFTGLPAVDKHYESKKDAEEVYISSEVKCKFDYFPVADKRLNKLVESVKPPNYEFVYNFDDFGTRHESSYIAVVHTDGNGMGKRFQNFDKENNREYIIKVRALSKSVEETSNNALCRTVERLIESIKSNKIEDKIEISGKLPFRPIVFGGDDVTFVCDGRLGLTLAEFYLRTLTSKNLSDKELLYARAGVAVVKSHYPFSRAVVLAEELTKSAKKYINERQKSPFNEKYLSAIDWHLASGGIMGELKDIRDRQYTVNADNLLYMRPLRLVSSDKDWHSWETFKKTIEEFRGNDWAGRHNKIMSLREALRNGPEAVKQFITMYDPHRLPEIPGNEGASSSTGWIGKCCTCYDAIEALDFFVPLKEENDNVLA